MGGGGRGGEKSILLRVHGMCLEGGSGYKVGRGSHSHMSYTGRLGSNPMICGEQPWCQNGSTCPQS